MVTDNISQKNSERLWQFLSAALFALGGIWLQNQFNMMTELQAQIVDLRKDQLSIHKYVNDQENRGDDRYVTHSLWNVTTNRLNSVEAKLDRLIELNNGNSDYDKPRRKP